MHYLVFDAETTTNCPIGNFSANPMWPGNYIVEFGYKSGTDKDVTTERFTGHSSITPIGFATYNLLVGHNIKFDLLYLLQGKSFVGAFMSDFINSLPPVWDTQLAEYLLTGQRTMYASLDDLSEKYGGTLKDSYVSDAFKAGVPTELINPTKLTEYLKNDVLNTEIVFKAQITEASKLGMLDFIHTQMKALVATTIMNFNGLQVHSAYISEQCTELGAKIFDLEIRFNNTVDAMKDSGTLPSTEAFSIASTKDLSMILYGGSYKVKERIPDGLYKNGNPKFKTVEKVRNAAGLGLTATVPKNKNGYYSVDVHSLEKLKKTKPGGFAQMLIDAVLSHREFSKQKETYYENLNKLTMYGKVYPKVNHTSTKTGRLSCSEPNLQNQTSDGGVKKAFVSRFTGGKLIDLDYSQLEIVALAVLSGDRQLLEDINSGVDMHSELYKKMYRRYPSKEERKPFKSLSFGLVYGAGYKSLAVNAGCSEADAKTFIKVFYERYSGVERYHKGLRETSFSKRICTGEHDPDTRLPIHIYEHVSTTGRRYVFKEYPNTILWGKDKGKVEMAFSQPELKNWPVQGFATGDIVPMMVGILVEELYKKYVGKVLPIMTVHDSVLLDVDCENVNELEVAKFCKSILERAPYYVETLLHTPFPVTLKVEATSGTNWLEQDPIHL